MKKWIVTVLFCVVVSLPTAMAQCAMCRSTVENNASRGDVDLAAGLNTGILYLFFTPYLIVGTLIFLWIRHSRKNAQKKKLRPSIARG
ncbi:MAG TPA: hypothetical protein DCE41_14575 [Cytophagales bacterium]|nr:hypothetical protein [Cytophagales bacterium]HAA17883.1 hypothetical protein [Cytophagales bacterium]HAP58194.1 hypothetical protein [Cytophagales bacterium]